MKPPILLFLTLCALPAFGGEPRPVRIAPVSLYAQFQVEPPEAVMDALREELATIMAPLGLHFKWRALAGVRGNEVSVELAVLTFKGRCDVHDLVLRTGVPGALGWTHVSDGAILPFADVDCDRLRGFVQKDLLSFDADEREAVFGRALGRVVAHELYHIFANTSRHGSDGVAKAAYTVQELLTEEFQFEGRESREMRSSKAHQILERASRAPSLE
jgi:hypothetical protein